MAGPHGKAMPGAKSQVENPGKIFMRVLRYVFSKYKIQSIIVVVCIIFSVIANVQATMFLQKVIDIYVPQIIKSGNSD